MGEASERLASKLDVVSLGAVERVKGYVRNGRWVRGHARKGDGPGHRATANELEELLVQRAEQDAQVAPLVESTET